MDNQFLQCLNNSKILLLHAKNESWSDFELLQPIWSKELEDCLENRKEHGLNKMMKVSVQELMNDVDKIQDLIKVRISKIEADFSANLKTNKAVQSYLT